MARHDGIIAYVTMRKFMNLSKVGLGVAQDGARIQLKKGKNKLFFKLLHKSALGSFSLTSRTIRPSDRWIKYSSYDRWLVARENAFPRLNGGLGPYSHGGGVAFLPSLDDSIQLPRRPPVSQAARFSGSMLRAPSAAEPTGRLVGIF